MIGKKVKIIDTDAIGEIIAVSNDFASPLYTVQIGDPRFVLVGRGMYALSEWGYKEGTAKDVIMDILKKNGPLSKEDVIKKVNKERYFKTNTILVNLLNTKYFKKNKAGLFTLTDSA
jgi:Holliday junction resolvasome RuvABC DNA-binding subunit